jgi:hypothetical protein
MAYRAHTLVEGFEKANSENLPELHIITLAKFIAKDNNFISPEITNIKAMRNGRESYGDSQGALVTFNTNLLRKGLTLRLYLGVW